MISAGEKSKEIRIEMSKEVTPVQMYLLTGCRVESKTGDLYVAVMLYDTPALTRYRYRVVKKFEKSEYEPLMADFRERMKDTPSLRAILASSRREYYIWQGYFCALVGSQVLTELLDDLVYSGVEKIDWVVYGKGGHLISAYLDRFFDINYSQSSKGVGAGSPRRQLRYYGKAEETFAKEQMIGVGDAMRMLSRSIDIDVRLSAYAGPERCADSEQFDSAHVLAMCKAMDLDLKRKTTAVCLKSYLGTWCAGKEGR